MNRTGCPLSAGAADAVAVAGPTITATVNPTAATATAAYRRAAARSGVVGNDLDRAESGGLEIGHHRRRVTDHDTDELLWTQSR